MANTLIIRHGGSKPEDTTTHKSKLKPWELGFDYTNSVLYINKDDSDREGNTIPIGADLSLGLLMKFGGTGAVTQAGAFTNIVAPGGTMTGPIKLGGEQSGSGSSYKLPGCLILNEDYSYGTSDPNQSKPLTTPQEGHLYFMLID